MFMSLLASVAICSACDIQDLILPGQKVGCLHAVANINIHLYAANDQAIPARQVGNCCLWL